MSAFRNNTEPSPRRGLKRLIFILCLGLIIFLIFRMSDSCNPKQGIQGSLKIQATPNIVTSIKKLNKIKVLVFIDEFVKVDYKDSVEQNSNKKRTQIVRVKTDLEYDLSKIKKDDIKIKDNILYIKLPELDINIIRTPKDIKILFSKGFTRNDLFNTEDDVENRVKEDMKKNDVLKKAEEQGKKKISQFLKKTTGVSEVIFE